MIFGSRDGEALVGGAVSANVGDAEVHGEQGSLPAPDEVRDVVGTRTGLYLLLLGATLLMGCAEVLRDNCGQTFMPSLVAPEHLERANGRMWAAESMANTFIGPPLGSLLLLSAFSLPFFVNSRMVVCGDPKQVDLPIPASSGLADAVNRLEGVEGINVSYFTSADVVRHPIVGRIVDAYEGPGA